MRMLFAVVTAVLTLLHPVPGTAEGPDVRVVDVTFAKGATSTTVAGKLQGDSTIDYVVRAAAGQRFAVTLEASNPQNYFNVLPPGTETAMFMGHLGGVEFTGVLPADGDYTVRVYLMRAAARRNEASDYRLAVGVTGEPLAPLPPSQDALVPGTPYHASATIRCVPYLETEARDCPASVIRRGFDGTATVEIRGAHEDLRRILFVKGKPEASDSAEPLSATRGERDTTVVTFGSAERYEIPDALLTGG